MTTMSVMPRDARDWTVADLENLPDDGLQYELVDGMLLVTPAPVVMHQIVLGSLYLVLAAGCSSDLAVLLAPVDWQPDEKTSFQPDLLVMRDLDTRAKNVKHAPVLAVEVLSRSTRRKDLVLKRSVYEDAGVQSYWMIDPATPSILAVELVDGRYAQAGAASGDESLTLLLPFPVTITPSALLQP